MADQAGDITRLLDRARGGDDAARAALLPAVYEELRGLADAKMRQERADHTLEPTALVHEAYLRLVGHEGGWSGRAHFFGTAAEVMRRVLVDHARGRGAAKRGAGAVRAPLDDTIVSFEQRETMLLDLDEALQRLADMDREQTRIVELRFFGGLTAEEIADLLGTSVSTVERRWRLARAWLLRELDRSAGD